MRFLALPLLLAISLAACSGGGTGADGGQGPAQKARDVIISQSEKGEGNWLLTAKDADFYQDPVSYVTMQNPHLVFKVKGEDDSSVKSLTGRYDLEAALITLTGNVVGKSQSQGAVFETEKLFYDTQTKLLWADTPVTLTRGGITVKGRGLKANEDLSEIQIFKQKTRLPPNIEAIKAKSEVQL